MKQQAAKIYIGLVAGLGLVVLVANSINVRTGGIDPVMFIVILLLAGIAQRNPVVLFRSSAISVAFAVKIAAYVLFGTPVALWATVVVVAVNAYTPKPKPARKILFNFGGMMLSTYLASLFLVITQIWSMLHTFGGQRLLRPAGRSLGPLEEL